MPILVAFVLGMGSFLGYIGVQSGAADKVVCNICASNCQEPLILDVQQHNNMFWEAHDDGI